MNVSFIFAWDLFSDEFRDIARVCLRRLDDAGNVQADSAKSAARNFMVYHLALTFLATTE